MSLANTSSIMSRERFLKSAQNKKCLNKSKAVPNMRIEALLEATCKRLRLERKMIKREMNNDDELIRDDEETTHSSPMKKTKFDSEMIDFRHNHRKDMEEQEINDYTPESDDNFHREELLLAESSMNINMMEEDKDLNKSSLWDDPKQVEDFLRLVNATNNSIKNNNNNNNNIENQYGKKIGIEFEDDFLETCDDDLTSNLSSFVTNYDVNSFTVEFDNLYKELVQNLVTVETFMSQPTCM